MAEALYDRAAHPPPPPGTYQPQQPLYQQPPAGRRTPPTRACGPRPRPPEPEGPTQYLPYGDDPRTTQFVGVDDLVTQAGEERHEPDAFAHLFRDQQQRSGRRQSAAGARARRRRPRRPAPEASPAQPARAGSPPPRRRPGQPVRRPAARPSLLKSSAVMAAGTLVSRLTGFVRSALIVAALGVGAARRHLPGRLPRCRR